MQPSSLNHKVAPGGKKVNPVSLQCNAGGSQHHRQSRPALQQSSEQLGLLGSAHVLGDHVGHLSRGR